MTQGLSPKCYVLHGAREVRECHPNASKMSNPTVPKDGIMVAGVEDIIQMIKAQSNTRYPRAPTGPRSPKNVSHKHFVPTLSLVSKNTQMLLETVVKLFHLRPFEAASNTFMATYTMICRPNRN